MNLCCKLRSVMFPAVFNKWKAWGQEEEDECSG